MRATAQGSICMQLTVLPTDQIYLQFTGKKNMEKIGENKGEPFNYLLCHSSSEEWFDPRFQFLVLVVFQSLAIFSGSSCTYMQCEGDAFLVTLLHEIFRNKCMYVLLYGSSPLFYGYLVFHRFSLYHCLQCRFFLSVDYVPCSIHDLQESLSPLSLLPVVLRQIVQIQKKRLHLVVSL